MPIVSMIIILLWRRCAIQPAIGPDPSDSVWLLLQRCPSDLIVIVLWTVIPFMQANCQPNILSSLWPTLLLAEWVLSITKEWYCLVVTHYTLSLLYFTLGNDEGPMTIVCDLIYYYYCEIFQLLLCAPHTQIYSLFGILWPNMQRVIIYCWENVILEILVCCDRRWLVTCIVCY